MTLYQLSHQYRTEAAAISGRISVLRRRMLREEDPQQREALYRRILALKPLLQQNRATAHRLAHYYDRGGRGHA